MTDILVKNGANVNYRDKVRQFTITVYSVSQYNTLVHILQKGLSPLWKASYNGHSSTVLLLLQHNAQVDLPTDVRYMQ